MPGVRTIGLPSHTTQIEVRYCPMVNFLPISLRCVPTGGDTAQFAIITEAFHRIEGLCEMHEDEKQLDKVLVTLVRGDAGLGLELQDDTGHCAISRAKISRLLEGKPAKASGLIHVSCSDRSRDIA